MKNSELYNKFEDQIITTLKEKHPSFTDKVFPSIITRFRLLDLDINLLIFLYNRKILTYCLLNIIHNNISKKLPFTSKNKILDIRLLFDFKLKDKYYSEKYWNSINKTFQKLVKYKRYEQPRT